MNKWISREKYGYLGMSLLIILIFGQLYYFAGNSQLVFSNVFIYFFNGVPYFDKGTSFFMDFPWYWFGIQIFLLYRILLNIDFTHNRIEQFLIREDRNKFYNNQIKKIVFLNLSYIVLILFWIVLLCGIFKIPFLGDHYEMDYLLSKIPYEVQRSALSLFLAFMVSVMISILLSLIMWVLYIIVNGAGAFAVITAYYVGAFFISNPIFLPNYLMIGRTLQQQYGIEPRIGMITGIVVFAIVYILGLMFMKSKDIV